MTEYNVHIGDTDRQFLRVVKIEATNSFDAANRCGVQTGEHILRVATPAKDELAMQKFNCKLHEIYGKGARNDEITNSQSLTNKLYTFRENAKDRERNPKRRS